jgi:hypothetical protein
VRDLGTDPAGCGNVCAGEAFRLLRAGFLAVFATVLLASCAYLPVQVDGVRGQAEFGPNGAENPWVFVPVGAWITRDAVTPVAVGMCPGGACSERIAVAVVDISGAEARALARSLAAPSGLVSRILEGNRRRRALVAAANRTVPAAVAARRMPRRVAASARTLRHRSFSGFAMTIRRQGDVSRTAHSVVFGRQRGGTLRVVVVVGARAPQVESAARSAADANL